jgi:trigger factor
VPQGVGVRVPSSALNFFVPPVTAIKVCMAVFLTVDLTISEMNITRENIDDLNAVLTVKIDKADYEEKVESVLKDYRKKANIKGFRPGNVPIGLVKKIYGRAVQIDEINKIVTENVSKYISDEKIEILGDPMPKEGDQESIDFDTQEDFTFNFELGLTPAFELKLSKKNKVNLYEITIDDKMRNDYIENYSRRFGELRKAEQIADKDVVKGKVEELDADGNIKTDGITVEETSVGIDIIKDNDIKQAFIGKSNGESVDFDIRKAFPNDSEIAGILHRKRDEVAGLEPIIKFTINDISRFYPAEQNQELYNKIYGEGVVNSDEEFVNKINEEIGSSLQKESDYKVMLDIKELALEKTEFELPEAFLKRWLLKVNENTTEEMIDKEFDSFRKDLKWQLIRNRVARDNEMKISEEELQKEAENITRYQFQQYGLFNVTDEQLAMYAKETLKREEDAKRIADKILEEKVIAVMREMVKLENKSITVDEFNKLFSA